MDDQRQPHDRPATSSQGQPHSEERLKSVTVTHAASCPSPILLFAADPSAALLDSSSTNRSPLLPSCRQSRAGIAPDEWPFGCSASSPDRTIQSYESPDNRHTQTDALIDKAIAVLLSQLTRLDVVPRRADASMRLFAGACDTFRRRSYAADIRPTDSTCLDEDPLRQQSVLERSGANDLHGDRA